MKEAFLQIQHGQNDSLVADEDDNILRSFHHNQKVIVKIQGVQKERSYDQLKCWFGVCRYCSQYLGEPMLNTEKKMSDYALLKTNHVEFGLTVNGIQNFRPVSIAYSNMEHLEACGALNDGLEFMCIDLMHSTVEAIVEELRRQGKYKGKYQPDTQ